MITIHDVSYGECTDLIESRTSFLPVYIGQLAIQDSFAARRVIGTTAAWVLHRRPGSFYTTDWPFYLHYNTFGQDGNVCDISVDVSVTMCN